MNKKAILISPLDFFKGLILGLIIGAVIGYLIGNGTIPLFSAPAA